MARFETTGLDEIIESMGKMGQTTGALAEKMLFAGAEQIKLAWKQSANEHKLRLTDQMFNSIGYANKPNKASDILSIDIYPQGLSTYTKDTKGKIFIRKKAIRNAEIAFVNHYGTSKRPGTHWVDTADDIAGPLVEEELQKIYDEWLEKNGYL